MMMRRDFKLCGLSLAMSGVVASGFLLGECRHRQRYGAHSDFATIVERTVQRPMGLILEEGQNGRGAFVVSVNPLGNARTDVLINDVLLAVNNEVVSDYEFDDVMEAVQRQPGDAVRLTLGRGSEHWVEVRWPNGVGVAATPGESMKLLAAQCLAPVQYSCDTGSCGVCEHKLRDKQGQERYARICRARVPSSLRGVLDVLPTDR